MNRYYGFAMIVVMLGFFSGCGYFRSGKPTAAVSGHVTYQGKPVNEGQVIFIPVGEGYAVSAELQSGGTYRVQTQDGGLLPGSYQVSVVPPVIKLPDTPQTPGQEITKEVDNIPAKYRSTSTSGLEITVKTKATTLDIAMTD